MATIDLNKASNYQYQQQQMQDSEQLNNQNSSLDAVIKQLLEPQSLQIRGRLIQPNWLQSSGNKNDPNFQQHYDEDLQTAFELIDLLRLLKEILDQEKDNIQKIRQVCKNIKEKQKGVNINFSRNSHGTEYNNIYQPINSKSEEYIFQKKGKLLGRIIQRQAQFTQQGLLVSEAVGKQVTYDYTKHITYIQQKFLQQSTERNINDDKILNHQTSSPFLEQKSYSGKQNTLQKNISGNLQAANNSNKSQTGNSSQTISQLDQQFEKFPWPKEFQFRLNLQLKQVGTNQGKGNDNSQENSVENTQNRCAVIYFNNMLQMKKQFNYIIYQRMRENKCDIIQKKNLLSFVNQWKYYNCKFFYQRIIIKAISSINKQESLSYQGTDFLSQSSETYQLLQQQSNVSLMPPTQQIQRSRSGDDLMNNIDLRSKSNSSQFNMSQQIDKPVRISNGSVTANQNVAEIPGALKIQQQQQQQQQQQPSIAGSSSSIGSTSGHMHQKRKSILKNVENVDPQQPNSPYLPNSPIKKNVSFNDNQAQQQQIPQSFRESGSSNPVAVVDQQASVNNISVPDSTSIGYLLQQHQQSIKSATSNEDPTKQQQQPTFQKGDSLQNKQSQPQHLPQQPPIQKNSNLNSWFNDNMPIQLSDSQIINQEFNSISSSQSQQQKQQLQQQNQQMNEIKLTNKVSNSDSLENKQISFSNIKVNDNSGPIVQMIAGNDQGTNNNMAQQDNIQTPQIKITLPQDSLLGSHNSMNSPIQKESTIINNPQQTNGVASSDFYQRQENSVNFTNSNQTLTQRQQQYQQMQPQQQQVDTDKFSFRNISSTQDSSNSYQKKEHQNHFQMSNRQQQMQQQLLQNSKPQESTPIIVNLSTTQNIIKNEIQFSKEQVQMMLQHQLAATSSIQSPQVMFQGHLGLSFSCLEILSPISIPNHSLGLQIAFKIQNPLNQNQSPSQQQQQSQASQYQQQTIAGLQQPLLKQQPIEFTYIGKNSEDVYKFTTNKITIQFEAFPVALPISHVFLQLQLFKLNFHQTQIGNTEICLDSIVDTVRQGRLSWVQIDMLAGLRSDVFCFMCLESVFSSVEVSGNNLQYQQQQLKVMQPVNESYEYFLKQIVNSSALLQKTHQDLYNQHLMRSAHYPYTALLEQPLLDGDFLDYGAVTRTRNLISRAANINVSKILEKENICLATPLFLEEYEAQILNDPVVNLPHFPPKQLRLAFALAQVLDEHFVSNTTKQINGSISAKSASPNIYEHIRFLYNYIILNNIAKYGIQVRLRQVMWENLERKISQLTCNKKPQYLNQQHTQGPLRKSSGRQSQRASNQRSLSLSSVNSSVRGDGYGGEPMMQQIDDMDEDDYQLGEPEVQFINSNMKSKVKVEEINLYQEEASRQWEIREDFLFLVQAGIPPQFRVSTWFELVDLQNILHKSREMLIYFMRSNQEVNQEGIQQLMVADLNPQLSSFQSMRSTGQTTATTDLYHSKGVIYEQICKQSWLFTNFKIQSLFEDLNSLLDGRSSTSDFGFQTHYYLDRTAQFKQHYTQILTIARSFIFWTTIVPELHYFTWQRGHLLVLERLCTALEKYFYNSEFHTFKLQQWQQQQILLQQAISTINSTNNSQLIPTALVPVDDNTIFWIYASLLSHTQPLNSLKSKARYSSSYGLRRMLYFLNYLVTRYLSCLYLKLQQFGLSLEFLFAGSFQSLFADLLNTELLMRVWDLIFLEISLSKQSPRDNNQYRWFSKGGAGSTQHSSQTKNDQKKATQASNDDDDTLTHKIGEILVSTALAILQGINKIVSSQQVEESQSEEVSAKAKISSSSQQQTTTTTKTTAQKVAIKRAEDMMAAVRHYCLLETNFDAFISRVSENIWNFFRSPESGRQTLKQMEQRFLLFNESIEASNCGSIGDQNAIIAQMVKSKELDLGLEALNHLLANLKSGLMEFSNTGSIADMLFSRDLKLFALKQSTDRLDASHQQVQQKQDSLHSLHVYIYSTSLVQQQWLNHNTINSNQDSQQQPSNQWNFQFEIKFNRQTKSFLIDNPSKIDLYQQFKLDEDDDSDQTSFPKRIQLRQSQLINNRQSQQVFDSSQQLNDSRQSQQIKNSLQQDNTIFSSERQYLTLNFLDKNNDKEYFSHLDLTSIKSDIIYRLSLNLYQDFKAEAQITSALMEDYNEGQGDSPQNISFSKINTISQRLCSNTEFTVEISVLALSSVCMEKSKLIQKLQQAQQQRQLKFSPSNSLSNSTSMVTKRNAVSTVAHCMAYDFLDLDSALQGFVVNRQEGTGLPSTLNKKGDPNTLDTPFGVLNPFRMESRFFQFLTRTPFFKCTMEDEVATLSTPLAALLQHCDYSVNQFTEWKRNSRVTLGQFQEIFQQLFPKVQSMKPGPFYKFFAELDGGFYLLDYMLVILLSSVGSALQKAELLFDFILFFDRNCINRTVSADVVQSFLVALFQRTQFFWSPSCLINSEILFRCHSLPRILRAIYTTQHPLRKANRQGNARSNQIFDDYNIKTASQSQNIYECDCTNFVVEIIYNQMERSVLLNFINLDDEQFLERLMSYLKLVSGSSSDIFNNGQASQLLVKYEKDGQKKELSINLIVKGDKLISKDQIMINGNSFLNHQQVSIVQLLGNDQKLLSLKEHGHYDCSQFKKLIQEIPIVSFLLTCDQQYDYMSTLFQQDQPFTVNLEVICRQGQGEKGPQGKADPNQQNRSSDIYNKQDSEAQLNNYYQGNFKILDQRYKNGVQGLLKQTNQNDSLTIFVENLSLKERVDCFVNKVCLRLQQLESQTVIAQYMRSAMQCNCNVDFQLQYCNPFNQITNLDSHTSFEQQLPKPQLASIILHLNLILFYKQRTNQQQYSEDIMNVSFNFKAQGNVNQNIIKAPTNNQLCYCKCSIDGKNKFIQQCVLTKDFQQDGQFYFTGRLVKRPLIFHVVPIQDVIFINSYAGNMHYLQMQQAYLNKMKQQNIAVQQQKQQQQDQSMSNSNSNYQKEQQRLIQIQKIELIKNSKGQDRSPQLNLNSNQKLVMRKDQRAKERASEKISNFNSGLEEEEDEIAPTHDKQ